MSKERAEGLKKYEENLEKYKIAKAKKKATAKVINNALKGMFHSAVDESYPEDYAGMSADEFYSYLNK